MRNFFATITLAALQTGVFAAAKNDRQTGTITAGPGEALRIEFKFNSPKNLGGDFKIYQPQKADDGQAKKSFTKCQRLYWQKGKMEYGGGKTKKPVVKYEDGAINFYMTDPDVWGRLLPWGGPAGGLKYYTMPNFHNNALYTYDQIVRDLPVWEKEFEKYYEHNYVFEFRHDTTTDWTYCYLDGNFIGHLAEKGPVGKVAYNLHPEVTFKHSVSSWKNDTSGYSLPPIPRRSAEFLREGASLEISPKVKKALGDFIIWDPAESIDQGKHGQTSTAYGFGNAPKWLRTPFATGPEYFQWMVPRDFYLWAYVLCADIPEDGKKPMLGCSMTRFGGAVNRETFATGFTDLSVAATNKSICKVVGKLNYQRDGKKLSTPLYLVKQKMNVGQIVHILHDKAIFTTNEVTGAHGRLSRMFFNIADYLDFEFVGSGTNAKKGKSSVHVFGGRLLPAPYAFDIAESVRGNCFASDEKPVTGIEITACKDNAAGTVEWTISDDDFHVLKSGSKDFALAKRGEKKILQIDLAQPQVGWYQLDYRFLDAKGVELMKHRAAFTLLAPDDREAGFESPYACWPLGVHYEPYRDHKEPGFWQLGRHWSMNPNRIEVIKNMHKLGYHSSWVPPVKDENEFPEYKITQSVFSKYCNGLYWPQSLKYKPEDLVTMSNKINNAIQYYKEEMTRYPHCKTIQILHEQGWKGMSQECAGLIPAKRGEYQGVNGFFLTLWSTELAKRLRKEFPGYHIQIGNGSSACEMIGKLCRTGFDLDLVDTLGIESKGFGTMPEQPNNLESPGMLWALKETAELFGYSNKFLNACNEYVFRGERPADVVKTKSHRERMRVTDYTLRDFFVSLAHGCWTISTGHLEDANGDYYETAWGAGGHATFYPYSYPKRMYTALAVFTRVFDKAKLSRALDTGANCTYALEFARDRKKKDFAYGCWTAQYPAKMEAKFPAGAKVRMIDWQGRERASGSCEFTASSTPVYFISDKPAESIKFVKSIADKVDGEMTVICDPTKPGSPKQDLPGLQQGDKMNRGKDNISAGGWYKMSKVSDPELGRKTLRLALDKSHAVPNKYIREGGALWFDKEKEFDWREYDEVGLWVKGNGGWGEITLTFKGKNGEFRMCPYRGFVNFDGWQLVRCPLKHFFDDDKEHKLSVRRICFSTARNALNPVEMVPVVNDLELGPVVGIKSAAGNRTKSSAQDDDGDWAMKMVDEKDL